MVNEMIAAMKKVQQAMQELNEAVGKVYNDNEMARQLIDHRYPFHKSYDEMTHDVTLWVEDIQHTTYGEYDWGYDEHFAATVNLQWLASEKHVEVIMTASSMNFTKAYRWYVIIEKQHTTPNAIMQRLKEDDMINRGYSQPL